MANLKDLIAAGFDEGLVRQAVDLAGFTRKPGKGGLSLDAKGMAKVLKAYQSMLTKLVAKADKINVEKIAAATEKPKKSTKVEEKPKKSTKVEEKVKKPVKKPPVVIEDDDEEEDDIEDQDDDLDMDDEDEDE